MGDDLLRGRYAGPVLLAYRAIGKLVASAEIRAAPRARAVVEAY